MNGFCVKRKGGSTHPELVAYATQVQDPKTKQWTTLSFWCPHAQVPVEAGPSAASIRDQAIKLLPKVAIGTTGHLHTTLVNIQTLLWADTAASRSLGTVTIVGHRVALKIGFGHGNWDFGDHSTDQVDSPGAPYDDKTNPCDTPQCPGYYGHTYTDTGRMTITLSVSWQASYSLDGAAWQPVGSTPLTGPSARPAASSSPTPADSASRLSVGLRRCAADRSGQGASRRGEVALRPRAHRVVVRRRGRS